MKKLLTIWAFFGTLIKLRKGQPNEQDQGQSVGEPSPCKVNITFVFEDRNGKEHPVRMTHKGVKQKDGSVLVVIRFRELLKTMLS